MRASNTARSLLLALTLLGACALAQAQSVTQRFRNEPLADVIRELERQTHLSFIYKADVLDEQRRVTADFSHTSIRRALRQILPPDVGFLIEKRLVILYRRGGRKDEATTAGATDAQQADRITVQGRVVDEAGQSVVGATVLDVAAHRGAVTDGSGRFTLVTSPTATLQVSYIGYHTASVNVRRRQQLGVIGMKEAVGDIDEVVVIGYGTTRRQELTGAIDKLQGTQVAQQPVSTLTEALQGLSPNLTVQRRSSDPNALLSNINIRGISTLNSNAPLVVVDGVVSRDETLARLNMSDIDNISVLKDAGAAAIYGSRSGNGVILITTRKGKRGERPAVRLTTATGWQVPHLLYQPMPGWQNATMRNEAYRNVGRPAEYTDGQIADLRAHQSQERWFMREIFRNALQQDHNVSVSGGTDRATYMVSAGFFDQASNYVGNSHYGTQRYNLRSNLNLRTGILEMQALLAFTRENSVATTGTSIERDASRVPPYYYYKLKENGKYLINDVLSEFNPLGSLEAGGTTKGRNNDFSANVTADVRLTTHLSLKGVLGVNIYGAHQFKREYTVPYYTSADQAEPARYDRQRREVNEENTDSYFINSQLLANYQRQWARHQLKALLGLTNESSTSTVNALRLYYSNPDWGTSTGDDAYVIPGDGTNVSPERQTRTSLSSVLGRASYNWADRYMLEFSFRYDGTSKFAPHHRWSFFPSLSAGWMATDEPFMRPWLQRVGTLKLRASYGVLGNQSIDAYERYTRYVLYNNTYAFNNSGVTGAGFNLGSDNLRWERTQSVNLGLDASFLKGHLDVGFNWFYKHTRNILMRPVSATVFGTDQAVTNVGSMANKGWELAVTYRTRTGKVDHEVTLNLADTRNRLLSFPEQEEIAQLEEMWVLKKVGLPINSYYGYRVAGIFQSEDEIAQAALPVGATVYPGDLRFVDRNNDGVIDANDRFVLGNAFPRYTFSLGYTARWKQWDASLFINGVGKRDMMVRGELVEPFFGNYSYTIFQHQTSYWTPTNTNSRWPRLAAPGSTSEYNNYHTGSDLYIFNAAYARLKNITIGYTLPRRLTQAMHIQRVRLYATGQNLLTLSPMGFVDPEWSEFDGSMNYSVAITGCSYPPLRYWGFGLDIDF